MTGLWARGIAVAGLVLAGCGSGTDSGELPYRVAVLPDQSESRLLQMHQPLIDYLAATAGLELELFIPESYGRLVEEFASGQAQLAWFGGVTFIHAEARGGTEPLVMRDVDLEFTTDFLAPASTPERDLQGFAGRRLGFGPRLSTSGHIMPRYFLTRLGLEPETAFTEVSFSAGHDQTAAWVRDGEVDLGAVNSVVVAALGNEGWLEAGAVRIVWTTPPYRNYVWAVRSELDPKVKSSLLDAFLALDSTIPEHAAILAAQGAKRGYVPASSADYDELRQAAALLDEQAGIESIR